MNEIKPHYYDKFSCTADKCAHSCCKGWEIDIDGKTLNRYNSVQGAFGERLKRGIDSENGCFILDKDERCPFLNEKGLCDIIIELGEKELCQICSDHPRFRNYYSSGTEIGLGLCCEEAARIILTDNEPFTLTGSLDEMTAEETKLFSIRNELFEINSDKSKSLEECFSAVCEKTGCRMPNMSGSEMLNLLNSLEILDEKWKECIGRLSDTGCDNNGSFDEYAKHLLSCFLYRHLPDSLFDGNLSGRAAFCILSVMIIKRLCSHTTDIDEIIDTVRMYSSEIEYSDENMLIMSEW